MRGIPDQYVIILLGVYWVVTVFSWYSLCFILKNHSPRYIKLFTTAWLGWAVVMNILILRLYLFPPDPSVDYFYSLFSLVNALLIADLGTKLPLAISMTLFPLLRSPRSRLTIGWMGIILSAGIGLTFLYGILAGNRSIRKNEIELDFQHLPPDFEGFRIVQFSDTHLGSYFHKGMLKRMMQISNRFKPDVILYTGDLVNNFAAETEKWQEVFSEMAASSGKFAVLGNHDYGDYSAWVTNSLKRQNFHEIEKAYRDFGFQLLKNESIKIMKGRDSVYIAGVENWGHPPFPRYTDLEKVTKSIPDSAFCILMSHNPTHWKSEIRSNDKYKLTLSGHTHGLQWGINLAGVRFSLISLSYPEWSGLYEYQDRYLYVNSGTGMIGMHFRIDMPAEITLFTLKKR